MRRLRATRVAVGVFAAVAVSLTGCTTASDSGGSSSSGASGGMTTITISAPNQWTTSGSSFGPEFDALVKAFEQKEPSIQVKTNVLPLSSFVQTLSTQLSAGTASELVFNQATYTPNMVTPLDSYLQKPNPYVPGNTKWMDLYNAKYFGTRVAGTTDAQGHLDWVPTNLFGAGVFYNKDILSKAGVTMPINTFDKLLSSCDKIRAAGYTPWAMDTTDIAMGWPMLAISNMLLAPKYFNKLNVFNAAGGAGTSDQLTLESWTKAVLTGQISPSTPAFQAAMQLFKQFFDKCATKNWSGVTGTSGAMGGLNEFASGKAAMAFGTDYATPALKSVPFTFGTIPFPTVTAASSPLATGFAAQWGLYRGTAYMIPSTVKGAKLAAAIKFLQFTAAPQNIQTWLDATGSIPAINGAKTPPAAVGIVSGSWGEPFQMGFNLPLGPPGESFESNYSGYLLGTKSLSQETKYLDGLWKAGAKSSVKANNWSTLAWAK